MSRRKHPIWRTMVGRSVLMSPVAPTVVAPVAGDIIAARIAADGWTLELDIKGFKVGGNVGRGRDSNGAYTGGTNTVQYPLNPFSSPIVTVNVLRSGFDETTGVAALLSDTAMSSVSKRKAYTLGGAEQTNDETDNGTYITVRHAMTRRLAINDPATVSILADMYRDNGPGGSGAQSRAVTGLTITNNSTYNPKKPVICFMTVPRQFLSTDFVFEAFGMLGASGRANRTLAAMKFVWTGATSGVVVTKTILSMALSSFLRTDGNRPCVSLFKATLTTAEIATFTQAERINHSIEGRPFIGAAKDSLSAGTAFPVPGLPTSIPFICDKNVTMRGYATVDPAGVLIGTSTAGCTSSNVEQTNTANCYSSHQEALFALNTFMGRSETSGAVIYTRAGTYTSWGSRNTNAIAFGLGWVHVLPAPSTNKAGVILSSTAGQSITTSVRRLGGHVWIDGCTHAPVASANVNDGVLVDGPDSTATPTKWFWMNNCDTTYSGSHASPSPLAFGCGAQYYTNNTILNWVGATLTIGSGRQYYLIAGNSITNCTQIRAGGPIMGNNIIDTLVQNCDITASVLTTDQVAFGFNRVRGIHPVTIGQNQAAQTYANGICWIANDIVSHGSPTEAAAQVSADSDVNVISYFTSAYNQVLGQRFNRMYNSTGTVAIDKDGDRHFDIVDSDYEKRDTFADPVNGKQTGRIGNWSWSHGVESYGNVNLLPSFTFSHCSPNSDMGDFWPAGHEIGTVHFVADHSGDGSTVGTGDGTDGSVPGNYHHTATSSDCWGVVPTGMEMLPFDNDGNARNGTAGVFAHP